MKIKKMYQGSIPENKILNTYTDSQTDVYSCDYINNEFNNLNTYSTEETIIGTWIDGTPVYRRTVEYTLGSSTNTYKDVITIENINQMVNAYGWFTNVDVQFMFPRAYAGEDIMIYLDMANSRIREQHNYSYANGLPGYITIEYTKTTD